MVAKCGYPRGMLVVTFWLVFIIGFTTCLPIQTLNEIFRNVETDDNLWRSDLETLYAFSHKSWMNNEVPTELEQMGRDPTFYVFVTERTNSEETNTTTTATTEAGQKKDVDPWSLIWYMASFGGLVTFFLVVSCSECCCSKRTSNNNSNNQRTVETPPEVTQWIDETPPPPYDLFAPPSYDTLFYGSTIEKNKCEVYVVPIHGHVVPLQSSASSTSVAPT